MQPKIRAGEIIGKSIISEETGRKFGIVGNIDFIIESGELLNLILDQSTNHISELNLKEDNNGKIQIPFTAVRSIGDFVIVSENELI